MATSNPLQLTGLASNIDTGALVAQLMQVEQRPLDLLKSQQLSVEQRKSVLAEITSRLSSLTSKFQSLTAASTLNTKLVTTDAASTTTAQATVVATSEAANSSFKIWVDQLATTTKNQSPLAMGQAISASATLANAGFGLTPTTGTFTINNKTITIDDTTVLSDGTDAVGANTIIAKIRDSGAGVTASLVNDADGRLNKLQLTSASNIQLGSGADTSNFLTAAKVLSASSTFDGSNYNTVSTGNLGVTQAAKILNNARLTGLDPSAGSFKLNGVEIDYDPAVDTLNAVINRINASAAGVTASYDSVTDKLQLTNNSTGSIQIAMEATSPASGNFLQATGMLDAGGSVTATVTTGQNALYRIDNVANGAQQSSTSNTISGVISGVTLTLKNQSATPMSVNITQDTAATVSAVKDFVQTYNSAMSFLRSQTSYDPETKISGPFSGDSLIRNIEGQLKNILTGTADGLTGNYTKLADIGVSFGKAGSEIGATKDLVLDESKLTAALQDNSYAVRQVFNALSQTTTLTAGGTGSLTGVSGNPTARESGTYQITTKADGTISAIFTPLSGVPRPEVTGTIQAGQTNSTLIPGVILTAGATLLDGTHTITTTVQTKGVGYKAADYLDTITGQDGQLSSKKEEIDYQSESMQDQIDRMQARLDAKEKQLNDQFARMESALAQLKGQQSALDAALKQLQPAS